MKILITGGHMTPALAVIDKIKEKSPSGEIIFVGRKYLEKDSEESLEYKEIVKRKIKFYHLKAGRLTRLLNLDSLRHLLDVPLGFFQAVKIIKKEKPNIILSFGGYIALPVAIIGFLFGIPVFTHEQTINPGLTNKIIAFFAKKVFFSFPETAKFFPSRKAVLTGNPLREKIFLKTFEVFPIKKDRPVLYIHGGSLGSHSINLIIKKLIDKLLNDYIVIHQTGGNKKYADLAKLEKVKNSLDDQKKSRYFLKEYLTEVESAYVYEVCDLVIGRAGANTFFELVALQKPAIFIPLPWSANQEQKAQAKVFEKEGVGRIFFQDQPAEKLLIIIREAMRNLEKFKQNFSKLKAYYHKDASDKIIKEIGI